MKRKDVKAGADWLVTMPTELNEKSSAEQRQFFEETKAFLDNRYGKENCISATVHRDEKQPHMHYAFLPVTYDKKKEREKVSAKVVLNRKDLQSFHEDLDKHLKEQIPHIYERGVLNGQTVGVETVDQLKELTAKENALNKELEELNDRKTELQKILKNSDRADDIPFETEMKRDGLFSKKPTNRLMVDSQDFFKLRKNSNALGMANLEIDGLKRKNEDLRNDNDQLKRENKKQAKTLKTAVKILTFARDFIQVKLGVDLLALFKNREREQQQEMKSEKLKEDGPSL